MSDSNKINLITQVADETLVRAADKDAEQQAMFGGTKQKFRNVAVNMDAFENGLVEIVEKMETVVKNLQKSAKENLTLETVEVGLSLNAEGSIGIATAGVEANISLSFKAKST